MYFLFCSSSGSTKKPTGNSYAGSIHTIHTSSPSRNSTYPTIKTRNHSVHLASLRHRRFHLADSPPRKDGTGRNEGKQRRIGVSISNINCFMSMFCKSKPSWIIHLLPLLGGIIHVNHYNVTIE